MAKLKTDKCGKVKMLFLSISKNTFKCRSIFAIELPRGDRKKHFELVNILLRARKVAKSLLEPQTSGQTDRRTHGHLKAGSRRLRNASVL